MRKMRATMRVTKGITINKARRKETRKRKIRVKGQDPQIRPLERTKRVKMGIR